MQEIPESVKATVGGHQQRAEAEGKNDGSFLKFPAISGQSCKNNQTELHGRGFSSKEIRIELCAFIGRG